MRAVARPVRSIRLLPLISLVALSSACQTGGQKAMSIEEAKQVAASFTGSAFVPPPRTINDITAVLDQQKPADPGAAAQARAWADQPPPTTTNPVALAQFYYQRGLAARGIGRAKQEIEDLTRAREAAERAGGSAGGLPYDDILWDLVVAEFFGGNHTRAGGYLQQAVGTVPQDRRGALFRVYGALSRFHAWAGEREAAEAALQQLLALQSESRNWRTARPEWVAQWDANVVDTQGVLAEAMGRFADAEASYREGISILAANPTTARHPILDLRASRLATLLARQGRLLEAENEGRKVLLSALSKGGRYSTHTASMLRALAFVISEQGRFTEAEKLARATIDIYEKTGSSPDSLLLAHARMELAAALGFQGRWDEALAEYEAVRSGLAGDPDSLRRFVGGHVGYAVALLRAGDPGKAVPMLNAALDQSARLVGERHRDTARIRGLVAAAHAEKGDRRRALREFADATEILLAPSRDVDFQDESATRAAADQRLSVVLAAYIRLLTEIKGTPLEHHAGVDATAEAFRLAEVLRGGSVQQALDASAARAAAKTPALADLVRREQDAKKQINALYVLLANALSRPTDQQDQKVVANLRAQIDTLRRARQALSERIEKEFPAYAQLINPKPVTVEQARAILRPGEALIATYAAEDRTFMWAIPNSGPVAFAVAPMGARAMEEAVATLRGALDPSAKTLGDIPEFDLALAHRLYAALLDPVRSGWQQADRLLIVAHGPLGQLPLALLPTKPVKLAPESGAIFSNYREVPWLARTHAVTVLPSVASLATLRALPSGDPNRRPFVGFGDPYFSEEQASRAAGRSAPAEVAALSIRGVPITLRSSPKTQNFDSSQLAMLPRLPETADEVRSIALAMNADLTRDVFTGARANEKTVKTLDLSGYRVIAFATHGLVPGDLDGLTQPALALSAPQVADVDGDGLLTMEEILGLRLNADWVVLSACNTASGKGAGSETVSGLGRAFFYAGARALLVSNWPVGTTSARELTTDLFRRQQADRRITRAKALQETMNALIDSPGFADHRTGKVVFSYAHPIFWAPFTLVGDGGGN